MTVDRFPAVYILKKMLLIFYKIIITKLPSLRMYFSKSVGIELADEAGEVVVFEIRREKEASELGWVPDDEAVVGGAPRNDVVGGGIVDHVVGLLKERRRASGSGGGGGWRSVHLGIDLSRICCWGLFVFVKTEKQREDEGRKV